MSSLRSQLAALEEEHREWYEDWFSSTTAGTDSDSSSSSAWPVTQLQIFEQEGEQLLAAVGPDALMP